MIGPLPRPLRLIIADDNADMRWVVRTALQPEFTDVVEAADGRQLFWHLLRASMASPDGPSTNLVIIADVCMPTYSGLEVLDAWQDERAPVPVIVITSFPDDAVRAKVAALGAILLPKPFTRAALRRVVDDATRAMRSS